MLELFCIFRYCFGATDSKDAEEEDFSQLPMPHLWHIYTDKHFQGVSVEFPIRLKAVLKYSPSNTSTNVLVPCEELRIDFLKAAYMKSDD